MIRNGPSHLLAMTLACLLACFSTTLPGAENRIEFRTDANPSSGIQQRLSDPQQRRELRIQQRASVEEQNPDLQRSLQIDSTTAEALLDLLTDQQMDRMAEMAQIAHSGDPSDGIQTRADAETRRLDGIRALLGNDGLRRYQDYEATRTHLGQVFRIDARLSPADKLGPEQRERLLALFVEQFEREMQHDLLRARTMSLPAISPQLTLEGLQRTSQLQTIEANEKVLQRRRESNLALLREASAFLTPVQIQALSKDADERNDSLREWIEQEREHAGLDRAIPTAPATVDPDPPVRTPVAGNIRLSIRMTVNNSEGVTASVTGRNGEPQSFDAGDGLIVEATPTLFDDDWLNVRFHYYEKDAAGNRRRLTSSNGIGRSIAAETDSADYGGMSSTVVRGTKAYAVTTRVKVEGV